MKKLTSKHKLNNETPLFDNKDEFMDFTPHEWEEQFIHSTRDCVTFITESLVIISIIFIIISALTNNTSLFYTVSVLWCGLISLIIFIELRNKDDRKD